MYIRYKWMALVDGTKLSVGIVEQRYSAIV